MAVAASGRQVRKTRQALLGAFNELVLGRRYADIRVADIIGRADVGRSTFYEHFRDKDDIFRQSVTPVLAVLATAADAGCDIRHLQHMLDHFRENLTAARGMLNGPCCPQVVTVLAGLVAGRWRAGTGVKFALPHDLAAAQVAEALLGLVRAWLNGGAACPSAAVAAAMHASTTAMIRALVCSRPL